MNAIERIAALVLTLSLAFTLTACAGGASGGDSPNGESPQSNEQSDESQAALYELLIGEGLTSTFVGADVTDATVANGDDAQTVIKSLIKGMGGDETTDLTLAYVMPTETGTTYYIFRQEAGGIIVYGASAKLIVDKDGKVTGLVSSILPDVKMPPLSETAVSQEQAEKVVIDAFAHDGMANVKALSEYTAQVIIPLADAPDRYRLAWVVYVKSPSNDGTDQAYMANYVGVDGEYLFSMPVSEPNNAEAINGESGGFDFGAYSQQDKTFSITRDGKTTQVTVPVLVDKQSGKAAFLGDAKRKILCADHSELANNNQFVTSFEEDGESFNDKDIAVYANFIRVYDLFESIGWEGPNDQGTPALLLMNYMEDGEPVDNCVYSGRSGGWETFQFGRVRDYGSATDVIAHEFVHCVTSTTMTTNLYSNETGAINESMSDILGNLAEMMLDGDAGAWTIGENAAKGGLRSMSDPNVHDQPEWRWDVYYSPNAPATTELNDYGGVHCNSSLLNIVSYKLYKAGMGVEDQTYFWMNVALAMVPTTDYVGMAELLPWVLEQSGYGKYASALLQAIDEAGYTKLDKPSELPAGAGAIEFTYPVEEDVETGKVRIMCVVLNEAGEVTHNVLTWPVVPTKLASVSLPEGDYYIWTMVGEKVSTSTSRIYTDKGWIAFDVNTDSVSDLGTPVHVEAGKTVKLETNGLE